MATPAWSATRTWATGDVPTAAQANNYWRDDLNHVATPAEAQACRTVNTTLTTGVWGVIALGGETYDTDGFHDTVTNNSRMTIPTGLAGRYLLTGSLRFAANATGYRSLHFAKNGAALAGPECAQVMAVTTAAVTTCITGVFEVALVATDYVELRGFQSSGGNLDVSDAYFTIRKVSN